MEYLEFADHKVSRIGLGCWPLSGLGDRPDETEAIKLIHAALDRGVTLLDTADSYNLPTEPIGYGELLVAKALAQWGGAVDDILVATKGGRAVNSDGERYCLGSRAQITAAAEASLQRLRVDAIDLYYLHRPDPAVPFGESLDALADLVQRGLIRHVGVSNVNPAQIRQARDVLGEYLVAVQNQFSLWFRTSEPEIDVATELGLVFVPWSPFGGATKIGSIAAIPELRRIADDIGGTPHQVVLAWMMARYERVLPIPGTRKLASLEDSLEAVDVTLTPAQLAAVSAVKPTSVLTCSSYRSSSGDGG